MRKLAHWLEEHTPSESIDFYRELAISHAWEGGRVGQEIATLIRSDNLRALCEFELDYEAILQESVERHLRELQLSLRVDAVAFCAMTPAERENLARRWPLIRAFVVGSRFKELSDAANAEAVRVVRSCRQALAFFQKVEDLEIGIDKEAVAYDKFIEAEQLCSETNHLLKAVRSEKASLSPRISSVIYTAKRKISDLLGRVPLLGELDLRFGPGATRATRRKDASIRRKLAEKLQCSEDLFPAVQYVLEEVPHLVDVHSALDRVDEDGQEWSRVQLEVIPAKLSFVPKSAKTYRSICTEPGLNTLVQAGYGAWIAKRLAAHGIDIRDQTVNQRRAMEGSLTGALATLDLSSASDTVSREIVYELLPLDWAHTLNRARSSNVLLPGGSVIRQEKFSSMGNGFTFPLETLIFWGLAAACCRHDSDATVYGDDIIVPRESYALLTEVLHAVGFKVNLTKSYHKGPFRESCGKDYFRGHDVRPHYPRGWLSGQSLFVLHNHYARRGDTERAIRVLNRIHPALRVYGPDGYGDGHLLGDHPRRRPSKYTERGWSGYFFDTFVTRQSKDRIPLSRGEHVVPLYSIYRRSAEDWEYAKLPTKHSSVTLSTFWSIWARGKGGRGPAPLDLPHDEASGGKALPLPGVAGYKKITVYTLRD